MAVYAESSVNGAGGGLQLPGHNGLKRTLTPSPSMLSLAFYEPGSWTDSKEGVGFLFSLLTFIYALSLSVFSLALEMVGTVDQGDVFKMIFSLFMFCGGIITLLYFYFFLLHPSWVRYLERALSWIGVQKKFKFDKVEHRGAGAGSLYLRLGAVAFGIVGIVYCGLKLFLCLEATCKPSYIVTNIIQPLFIFLQMHFIFCNSKMNVGKNCKLAKFGIMHLVAVNLWTWFRNFLDKQKTKKKTVVYAVSEVGYSSESSEETQTLLSDSSEVMETTLLTTMTTTTTTTTTMASTTAAAVAGSDLLETIFGNTKVLMSTCLVEYSLIGAAVMFVMWVSIGSHHTPAHPSPNRTRVRRKNRMRVDCSASSTGLFFGLLYLILAFVGIGIFDAESQIVSGFAGWIFSQTDGILFICALIGCVAGMWRLRLLSYVTHSHGGAHSAAETLDEILLIIGVVGEIVFCSIMLLELISASADAHITFGVRINDHGVMLAYTIVRIVQVLLQTVLILIALKLAAVGELNSKQKPGKQFVTFLLVANISLFILHSYRSQRESDDGVGVFSGQAWTTVLQAVNPLLTFYRFHSSVCLAEVWKHAYTAKESSHHSHKDSNVSSPSSPPPMIHVNNEEHRQQQQQQRRRRRRAMATDGGTRLSRWRVGWANGGVTGVWGSYQAARIVQWRFPETWQTRRAANVDNAPRATNPAPAVRPGRDRLEQSCVERRIERNNCSRLRPTNEMEMERTGT
uniref:Otopetrin n=1 Tax=Plectus sambesii TaxID=2011161 RepID=A0A914XLE1_9BILA